MYIVRYHKGWTEILFLKNLTMLSLLHNPVVTRRNYREYVIHKFPNLKVILATTLLFYHLVLEYDLSI
jgi:hypothetical protein